MLSTRSAVRVQRVSDFFYFSIYVDAPEADTRRWYIERVLLLRATAFKARASYSHRYAALSDEPPSKWPGRSGTQ